MENLEEEVEELKKINSELLLKNASLETENNSLKNQIGFLRGIIQNQSNQNRNSSSSNSQQIDQYLNLSPKSTGVKTPPENSEYQSPFEEDSAMQWVRESYSSGAKSNWGVLFVATIVLCLFVVPSDPASQSMIAQQTGTSSMIATTFGSSLFVHGKQILKYVLVGLYVLMASSFLYGRYGGKKTKKV